MDLFSHLNWYYEDVLGDDGEPIKSIPTGKLLLITDTLESDGSFLIHYFLQSIFKNNQNQSKINSGSNGPTISTSTCILLGLNQSLYNYFNVGRKLGYNLTMENGKSSFSFINGLSNPYQWIKEQRIEQLEELGLEDEPPLDSISQGFAPFPIKSLIDNVSTATLLQQQSQKEADKKTQKQEELKSILHRIYQEFIEYHQQSLKKFGPTQTKCYFIIDNLNILTSYYSSQDSFILIMNFLQYLNSYVKEHSNTCTLISLFHSDCDEDSKYYNLLQYESDLTINIHGLKSGYSKDIDGQIEFLQKDINDSFHRANPIHYQVLDNNIRFFSLGSRI
ncbi:UPF0405 family protein [Tieghemostelium lacteum]|uniref:UPF0405 family protein n=1 Tax=Tieghemostelium lacteum TaxID=361077 RepID=A0A152A9W7_TIELA|nr:UPF0405 family protein [Tieghemostelium lacteum]|eukprot:KYR03016.1 UPF0405 family protein [Tieghemostelium lacteum]